MKKYIIGFILGGIICSFITAYATESILGTNVNYDNTKSGLASTDIQNAVDELYDMATYGDAGSGNILSGKTALVNGNKVTGTLGTQTKSATPSISSQTITPDSGNLLSSVTVNAVNGTKTLGATNGTAVDMGGAYRYVNTNAVYDAGKSAITGGTQTKLSQGSWSSNKMTVTASAGYNGSALTTTVDASSIYNAGVSAGSSTPLTDGGLIFAAGWNGNNIVASYKSDYFTVAKSSASVANLDITSKKAFKVMIIAVVGKWYNDTSTNQLYITVNGTKYAGAGVTQANSGAIPFYNTATLKSPAVVNTIDIPANATIEVRCSNVDAGLMLVLTNNNVNSSSFAQIG